MCVFVEGGRWAVNKTNLLSFCFNFPQDERSGKMHFLHWEWWDGLLLLQWHFTWVEFPVGFVVLSQTKYHPSILHISLQRKCATWMQSGFSDLSTPFLLQCFLCHQDSLLCHQEEHEDLIFRPSATKSGRPYGVTSASSLLWRTPPPHWLILPGQLTPLAGWPTSPPPHGITQSHDHVMDGWGTRPLRWRSVLVTNGPKVPQVQTSDFRTNPLKQIMDPCL